ncbi:MAG: hypothetical protein L7R83_01345 [Candidatus Poseidonia sp.]|nr:hypothetical protein [Poseidonia sp.]
MIQFNQGVFARIDDLIRRHSMIRMQHQGTTTQPDTGVIQRRQGIDPSALQPVRGQLYHLSGPGRAGKSMRCVAEHWVVHALAQGEVVHWVDGACRIDPSRFIPGLEALGADVEHCLSRLYLSRGFTLHQLDRQIERLPHELAITRAPMIVVDGLLAMHGDDAVSTIESRTLLRRHVRILRQLAEQQHVAVIAITGTFRSQHTDARLLQHLHRHAQNHLEGRWTGRRQRRRLHLLHRRSGLHGHWRPFENISQTRFRLTERTFNRRGGNPSLGILTLQHQDE